MRRLELLLVAGLALAGCKAQPSADQAEAAAPPPSLVGSWRTDSPVRYYGEDLRTEGQGQTDYRRDGSFRYTGKLTVQGEKLPPDGLSFRISGDGRWKLDNRTLSEDFTSVEAVPEVPNAALAGLGRQLGREMVDQPPAISLVDLRADRLTLRDRDTGQEAKYIRLR